MNVSRRGAERQRAQRISQESWRNESWPGARASHGNVNADNFDDCFRCWEIRRRGVSEKIIKILQAPQTPKLPVAKANMRSHKEVIGKKKPKLIVDRKGAENGKI